MARINRLVPLVFLLGCSSESPPPADTVSFRLEAQVAPGEEGQFCRFVRMPDSPLFVRGGRHELSDGTHHYLVYRTRDLVWRDGMEDVVRCDEHDTTTTAYVTGGQTPREDADFPADAGLPFRAGEILLLQAHFLNAASTPRTMTVDVTLRTAPRVDHEAGVLRFYDPFIHVPARGRATTKMACTIKKDITLLSAAAHMHRRGIAFRAYLGNAATPFYTTADGLHPTTFVGWQPIQRGTTLRFECDYQNDGDRTVTQGLSATRDEMCMLSGFYFPAMDPQDEICEDMHDHGTGQLSCKDTTACLEVCPAEERPAFPNPRVGECWQRCVTSSCPNVTKALFPQLTCTDQKCRAECAKMGDPCRACVVEKCTRELGICQRLACDP